MIGETVKGKDKLPDKFRFSTHFKCGGTECVLLKKDGRPLLVELPYVDQAISRGAEAYPETCSDSECWVELNYKDLAWLENELDWIYGW